MTEQSSQISFPSTGWTFLARGEHENDTIAHCPAGHIHVDYIAGNFGQSLEIEQAVRIGLLPEIPRKRIQYIGNSSLAGARTALLSRFAWRRAREIASSITCLELTVEPRYFEEYMAALFLPHTDLSLFPSIN